MKSRPRIKGLRLRLLYAILRLQMKLRPAGPDAVVSQLVAVRKANKPPAWTTLPLPADVKLVRETIVGRSAPIAIKKYLPAKLNPDCPRLLFMFGGGWITGGLETFDHLCASVSRDAGCLVVSVDYRLAPETPFPGALEDCHDALLWLSGDPSLGPLPSGGVVVMGESAGGNLAAALGVLSARNGGPAISQQILLYPALDATCASESMNVDLPGFEKKNMERVLDLYRAGAALDNPLLSPMFAENFSKLPPALIITADIDPLRDDGARFAKKLSEAGVPVKYVNYLGMPHGFFFMPGIASAALEGIAEISAAIMAVSMARKT